MACGKDKATLSEKLCNELNRQLNAELYSGYLYLSMSAYFKANNLDGFANWMYYQAQEELQHAMKFYDFITRRGGRVGLRQIDTPRSEWDSPQEVFTETLDHQRKITGMINDLVDSANEDKDHATQIFLQWFVTEQIEEEENAESILKRLKLLGDDSSGLYMLDRELAARGAEAAAQA